MSTIRVFILTIFLSVCSFAYVHAQSSTLPKSDLCLSEQPKTIISERNCPTAAAQNILPSENFLTKCIEKVVNSLSISLTLQKEEPIKPTDCQKVIGSDLEI